MKQSGAGVTEFSDILNGESVETLMSDKVLTAYEGWSVKRLASFFIKHHISGAPVIASDDTLVGVVSQADVVRFESQTMTEDQLKTLAQYYCGPFGGALGDDDIRHMRDKASENCTVNTIMTPEVYSVDVSASALDACQMLVGKNIHRVFVTRKGVVCGVVTARDVLKALLTDLR